ncbi:MAG: O-antigen ligase family protein [Saprospiraceae bacterium]|nr:O-antigen ligase family protein [Saprospiraceae bacterium]
MQHHSASPSESDTAPRRRNWWAHISSFVDHQFIGVLALLFIMIGMVVSEAMMSMGMIGLALNAVLNVNFKNNFRHFLQHRALIALTCIFLVYAVSGLWSENTGWYIDRLRMKLPFLLLPFTLPAIPRMDKVVYQRLLAVFFVWISLAALYSLSLYALDYDAITTGYREGRVLPTPVQHIRFSLMAALCVAIGGYLLRERFVWKYPGLERKLLIGLTFFLILYLHILAVRSGLLALYGILLYYAILLIVEHRKWWIALLLTASIVVAGVVAYRYVPSFQNRINYSLYSLRMFEQQEQIRDLSDARRIGSLQAAAALMREHPFTGVGIGDIRDATDAYLQQHYPEIAGFQLMPHNQFLLVGAATGLLGMLVFMAAMIWPLLYRRAWRDPLFAAFHLLILSSCMVEHTLETQLGTAFYMLFVLMGLRHFDEPNTPPQENMDWIALLGRRYVGRQ